MKMCINLVSNAVYDVGNAIGVKNIEQHILCKLNYKFACIFLLNKGLFEKTQINGVNGIKKTRHN